MVTAAGFEDGNPQAIECNYFKISPSLFRLSRLIREQQIDIVISWVNMKHLFLLPLYLVVKGLLQKKMIYWGQGRDLLDQKNHLKNLAYLIEQLFCDAIILYTEPLKKHIPVAFHRKVFVANNTLHLDYSGFSSAQKKTILRRYCINTKKNIILIGRMQKRKRVDHLLQAFKAMNRPDIGLILVGPDPEGLLTDATAENIYHIGALYDIQKYDLLSSADVFCLPGAVGLSIIDAFYCGLPLVTEDCCESAESAYLKDGVNGFLVPDGNIEILAQKLQLLMDDDALRRRFSKAALKVIKEEASMEKMAAGFRAALEYVSSKQTHA